MLYRTYMESLFRDQSQSVVLIDVYGRGLLANDTLFQACICMWSKIYVFLYYKSNLNSITRQKYSKHKQTCRYSGCIHVQRDNDQLGVYVSMVL